MCHTNLNMLLHSKPHKRHNTTHIELYIGYIFTKNIAHITATYKVSEHWIGVNVAVIRAVYGLPAK